MSLNIPRKPGVYLLLINVNEDIVVKTRSKSFYIQKGYYLYIGSARGKGGLYNRVKRYLFSVNKKFWHIDYLLSDPRVKLCGLMFREVNRLDHDWETELAVKLRGVFPYIEEFGCSDKKRNTSHLYRCGDNLEECLEKLVFLEKYSFKFVLFNQLIYKPL